VKDDDYRLSFLHGNYITLTNLTQKDLRRIIEQRLSPLYVSVHATAPELRSFILGRERVDDLEEKLSGLIRGGIRIHAQIVLMPGVNDGEQLRKTIFDLYALYPGIQSAAIVPVGLSDFGPRANCFTPVTPAYSRALIKQAVPWQTRFRSKIGRTFACLADEFYLQAGMRIPGREYYDDFVQIEDGIGMVRNFLDDFRAELVRRRRSSASLHGTLATGGLFYPILKRCMEQFNKRFGSKVRVRQIENRFMGSSITVAGLLGGNDILAALADKNIGDFLIIPEEAIARGSGILVDNLTCDDVSRRLGKPVYSSGRTVREFFTLLFRLRGAHLPEHKASKP
jgi:putative radical SAM enzyme (TIGR03279 family)